MKITDVPALKINKLTRQQFKKAVEENRINDNEIYLTPDIAEPYFVYITVNGSDIKLDTFHEFSGEELFEAIGIKRPVYLIEDEDISQLFILTYCDHDEGVAKFSRTSIVNSALLVQEVEILYDGTISSTTTTNKTDATLTLGNRAADAAAVGQKLAADAEALNQRLAADAEALNQRLMADAETLNQKLAADAAIVDQRLAALEANSIPAYTYGEEDLIPGETPLENGKLHFVYE